MFGTLGGPEILLLLVLALIVFGPRKLPEIGRTMGRMLAEFRRASNDFKRTIEDEVEAEKLKEVMADTREAFQAEPASAPPLAAAPEEGAPTPEEPPAEPAEPREPAVEPPESPVVSREPLVK